MSWWKKIWCKSRQQQKYEWASTSKVNYTSDKIYPPPNITGSSKYSNLILRIKETLIKIMKNLILPFQVSKINDIELTMTFELYFDLSWTESRFLINESSTKWGEVISITSFSLLYHNNNNNNKQLQQQQQQQQFNKLTIITITI